MKIYFDNNATTPLVKEVLEAMYYDFDGIPRNPSSVTSYGREARAHIIAARREIAEFFGIAPEEIIFTSGGTESNHLLIQGFYQKKPGSIITTAIEHASALEPIKRLTKDIVYLPVDEKGAPSPSLVEKAITSKTSFIFLSGANNETGVKIDLEEIASIAYKMKVPLLIDGVALLGKGLFTPLPLGVSGISFSSHKCHGPKGIGIAIVRLPHRISPLFIGGHQERDMRAGTENLAGIIGSAKALSLIKKETIEYVESLRNYFEHRLFEEIPSIAINGTDPRSTNVSNIYFPEVDAETLLLNLDKRGVITSLGSACSSGTLEPSHVLLGMGLGKERALSSLRFSFSRLNTKEEVEKCLFHLQAILYPATR